MRLIGITEGADPTINRNWISWIKEGKPAILITKMPRLLLPLLEGKENVIIHCTITGLGGTKLEPRIDSHNLSLEYYHKLCKLLGSERVVLRIDPIVYWGDFSSTLKDLIREAEGRIRVSFLDLYPHVINRFLKAGLTLPQTSFHKDLQERLDIWKALEEPEVCAEPGLPSYPCVGEKDCKILGITPISSRKGQRSYCNCLSNKKELCYPPPKCTYGCLYCYWKD